MSCHCGKEATFECWASKFCDEHKNAAANRIYYCKECEIKIQYARNECTACLGVICDRCLPDCEHYGLRYIDGVFCEYCNEKLPDHVCVYCRVPDVFDFCLDDIIQTEYGFYDTVNDVHLDTRHRVIKMNEAESKNEL